MKKVLIRADANSYIGLGHVMRCLAIAKELLRMSAVLFVTADEDSAEIIRKCSEQIGIDVPDSQQFRIVTLGSRWDDLEQEIEQLCGLIRQEEVETLLIDSYYVTYPYLARLKESARLVYLDDVNAFSYPVDVLINYNIYAWEEDYIRTYSTTLPEMHLGLQYAPLREEFRDVRRVVRKDVRKILILTGGTDEYNVLGSMLDAITSAITVSCCDDDKTDSECVGNDQIHSRSIANEIKSSLDDNRTSDTKEVTIYAIVGAMNRHRDELYQKYDSHEDDPRTPCGKVRLEKKSVIVQLIENPGHLSDLMKDCDLAISAAGVTTYELCACGTPTLLYTLADNQMGIAESLRKNGLMTYLGDVRQDLPGVVSRAVKEILPHLENATYEQRAGQSNALQLLVDGHGAERIAKIIVR